MITDFSYGVIPILETPNGRRYLLIQHNAGHWGFPKGHPKTGESEIEAANREFEEETGICDCRLLQEPRFEEQYEFVKRKTGRLVNKTVVYFLGYPDSEVVDVPLGELQDYVWGDFDATLDQMTFQEGKQLLRRVEAWLNGSEPPAG